MPRAGQAGTANEQPKTRICRAHLPALAKERNPGIEPMVLDLAVLSKAWVCGVAAAYRLPVPACA